MKKILIPALVVLAAVIVSPSRAADGPFPSPKVGKVFVAAQTVTTDGAMSNFFAPGSTVVFRAYAVDAKTHRILTTKAVKYFYAKIPGAPNVKMRYTPKAKAASGRWAWTGAWKVPSGYTLGIVPFRVLVTTKTKRQGAFRQVPVSSAQLTITDTPQLPPGPPPSSSSTAATASLDIALYADTVNGAGVGGRPIGCTQTNVFKRGEEVVVRTWGFDLKRGAVLSNDNVDQAYFSVPGVSRSQPQLGSARAAASVHVDERLDHPHDLSARRCRDPDPVHDDHREGREARLPDHHHPLIRK